MNLIERVKNIIVTPKTEWAKIALEPAQSMGTVITSYVVPLVLVGTVATFIGYGFIGADYGPIRIADTDWGWRMALIQFISAILGVIITSYVLDALAPSFGSEKNINRSTQLVAYGYTPAFIGAILNIFPAIGLIGSLFGLYGIYLMYEIKDKDESVAEPSAYSHLNEKELMGLINNLPDGYRLIFNLYVIEGYQHEEIATMLGIQPGTSRSQLVKARNMLKNQILQMQKVAV